jgi:hypothetical protein
MGSKVRVAMLCAAMGAVAVVAAPAHAAGYKVRDGGIVSAAGTSYVIRGAVLLPGSFLSDEAPAGAELKRAKRDALALRDIGVNTVRIDVRAEGNTPAHLKALAKAVWYARRAGHVVILSTVDSKPGATLEWNRYLAHRYRAYPDVWLQPARDPHCVGVTADPTRCKNWAAWRSEHKQYLKAIRGAGMRSPVLVSVPDRGRDLRPLARYALADRDVVYGVHRFGGTKRSAFTASERRLVNRLWAGRPSARRAVVVDEIGRAASADHHDRTRWTDGYTGFVTDWVLNRGGDGAIALGWNADGINSLNRPNGSLTRWGRTYGRTFLAVSYADSTRAKPRKNVRGWLQGGDRGRDVRELQRQLSSLGYLSSHAVDGGYGYATEQAIMAFQGYEGILRDGTAAPRTRARLFAASRPLASRGGAPHVEVSLARQTLLLVGSKGHVLRAIHVSTGAGGRTPSGNFSVIRKERMSWSRPFSTWMPWASYFYGGFAMHEYSSVPAYPASHGCVRMPSSEASAVYAYAGYGMPVFVA